VRLPRPGEVLIEQPPADVASPAPEPRPVRSEPGPPRPSLVVQTSFLGDVILTTPLIADLATRGPVDVVTTPAAAPLLANNPSIRDVIVYDKRSDAGGLVQLWRVSEHLKAKFGLGPFGFRRQPRGEEPIAYLAQGSIRSATLALLAGFRVRIGFATSAARALYTRRIPYRDDWHHVERLWGLGRATGAEQPPPDSLRPQLFPDARDVAAVDALLAREGYGGEPLVAIAPGSSWPTKRWPHYAALAAALVSDHEQRSRAARVVLIGGPRDTEIARAIAAALASHRPIDGTGHLSPLASADLIRRCDVLITNDSAPQHIASAVGTPTVAIFGPTVPEFGFGPLAPRHATAGLKALPCRPCHRHGPPRCPLGHWRCMRDLSVRDVAALVRQVTSAIPGP
jgi:lipopolysaccharide heptosyltransferase II